MIYAIPSILLAGLVSRRGRPVRPVGTFRAV
jgi:hypothetical protein